MAVFTAIGAWAFGAGTFLATVTAGALQVAAGVAMSLIAKSISGSRESESPKFGVQGKLQGGDNVPRSILFGYSATAGSFVYGNTWGTVSGVPNAYLTQVIALADYPIRELLTIEVNGIPDTMLTAEAIALGWPVAGFRRAGVDHMWVKFYDGTQVAADPLLVGSVASAERPYDSSRVGRGIPYVIVTTMAPERKDGEENPLFSNGIPRFKFYVNGAKLFDPTNGSHVWGNPATYGGDGDFLPVVQVYNLMRGITYAGEWLYGLQSMAEARLPLAAWQAEIAKCRALIEGPSGNEPTYRTGGEVQVGAQIRVAIEAMLTGSQGRLTEIGGVYKPHVGEPGSPVFSFTDADIIDTQEQMFTPFYGLEDTINGIQATYPNPAEGWATKTAPPLIRSDLEALDGNRRLMANVSLDMVPYTGQVQRLMLSALREAQRARRHTFVMGPEFWVLEPGDVVQWTSARNGYVSKLMRIDGIGDREDLDVMVDLTEVDPADYDWNQDEDFTPVVDGPLQLVGTPPMPMIGWQVYGVPVLDELERQRRPGIEVWYQSGLQGISEVRVQVRVPGATNPFIDIEVPYGDPWKIQIPGNFPALAIYEVRGIFVMEAGGDASWSAWLEVTTPDIRLGPLDVDLDDIIDEVLEDVAELDQWTRYNTRETIEAARRTLMLNAEGQLGDYNDRRSIRRELTAVYETSKASWSEDILVAAGPNSALVLSVTQLRAEVFDPVSGLPATNEIVSILSAEVHDPVTGLEAVGNSILSITSSVAGNEATGLFRIYTSATPVGADARIALTIAASGVAAPSSAALYMDALTGGNSQILLIADRIAAMSSPTGTKRGLLVIDGDNVYMDNARIRNLTAGNIQAGSISADRLVSGSITSVYINVAELVASSAFISNLVVDTANIASLAVTTLQIANGAIANYIGGSTFVAAHYEGLDLIQDSYVSDAFISSSSYPVTVSVNGSAALGTSGGDPDSNLIFEIFDTTTFARTVFAQWINTDVPMRIGKWTSVFVPTPGVQYRARLRAQYTGTGSVTFTSTPVFSAIVPKK